MSTKGIEDTPSIGLSRHGALAPRSLLSYGPLATDAIHDNESRCVGLAYGRPGTRRWFAKQNIDNDQESKVVA